MVIQVKATQSALFCGAVYKVSLWMKSQSVTIQMKTIEQFFPMVLFKLNKVVLTFESVE